MNQGRTYDAPLVVNSQEVPAFDGRPVQRTVDTEGQRQLLQQLHVYTEMAFDLCDQNISTTLEAIEQAWDSLNHYGGGPAADQAFQHVEQLTAQAICSTQLLKRFAAAQMTLKRMGQAAPAAAPAAAPQAPGVAGAATSSAQTRTAFVPAATDAGGAVAKEVASPAAAQQQVPAAPAAAATAPGNALGRLSYLLQAVPPAPGPVRRVPQARLFRRHPYQAIPAGYNVAGAMAVEDDDGEEVISAWRPPVH